MKDSYNFPDNYESLLEFVWDNKDLDGMFEVRKEICSRTIFSSRYFTSRNKEYFLLIRWV